jgi:hypothetical protein
MRVDDPVESNKEDGLSRKVGSARSHQPTNIVRAQLIRRAARSAG